MNNTITLEVEIPLVLRTDIEIDRKHLDEELLDRIFSNGTDEVDLQARNNKIKKEVEKATKEFLKFTDKTYFVVEKHEYAETIYNRVREWE